MKKKICLILLCLVSVVACAFGLSACGGGSDSGGGSNGPSKHEHVFDKDKTDSQVVVAAATCNRPAIYALTCLVCGETGATFEYGEPDPSKHNFREEIPEPQNLIREADCEHPAMYAKTCSYCGESSGWDTFYYGEIGEHHFVNEQTLYLVEYANCTFPAKYHYYCDTCYKQGDEIFEVGEPIPGLHDFSAEVTDEKYLFETATCRSPAQYHTSCLYCGESGYEVFEYGEPADHNLIVEATDYIAEEATCTTPAKYYYKCSECGQHGTKTFEYGEIANHKYNRQVANYCAEGATCTTPAKYYYMCEWCNAHNDKTFNYGEPLGHNWSGWEITTSATVDRNGKKTHSCSREDCSITEEETIPQLIATSGLEFKLSNDESYYACTGLSSQCNDVNIIIPSSYRGLPVKTIETAGNVYDPNFGVAYDKGSGFKNAVSVIIPDSVTEIGYNAFKGCTKLESVIFGDNVETVKTDAFNGCSALVDISFGSALKNIMPDVFSGCDKLLEIENSVFYVNNWVVDCYKSVTSVTLRSDTVGLCQSAFQDCNKLTDVVIVGELKTISATAFYNCSSLTNITIGSNVTNIEGGAFYNCNNITNIYYTGDLKGWVTISSLNTLMRYGKDSKKLFISGSEVKGSLSISNDITIIGEYAFYRCNSITSVIIPNSVKEIGAYAFDNCLSLTNINYTGNLTGWLTLDIATNILYSGETNRQLYIGGNTIEGDLIIPNGITSIRDFAFYECSGITSITIPNSVKEIGESAFRNCTLLTTVTIPDSVTVISVRAFYLCSGITDLTVGNSVHEIGEYAFYGCNSLDKIYISDIANWCSIKNIGNLTQYGDTDKRLILNGNHLTKVVIPEGVTRIEPYAFRYFGYITSVEIGSDVDFIGHGAFLGCTNLTYISFKSSGRWVLQKFNGTDVETKYIYEYEFEVASLKSFDEYSYSKVS
ncbi:MAG: leucine-rich repeat protein [Clostridia bacterium]|nr:leucine-rich repeat protein [Clostridia bacterium]